LRAVLQTVFVLGVYAAGHFHKWPRLCGVNLGIGGGRIITAATGIFQACFAGAPPGVAHHAPAMYA
jgi:hypothetical protein